MIHHVVGRYESLFHNHVIGLVFLLSDGKDSPNRLYVVSYVPSTNFTKSFVVVQFIYGVKHE